MINSISDKSSSTSTVLIGKSNTVNNNSNNDFSPKVWDKIDNFLNLGSTKDVSISDLSPDEKKQYLTALSKIMKDGNAGYSYYKVNGKIEKHYIVNTIGDKRLYGAKQIFDKYY